MLFITNRRFRQVPRSRPDRKVDFDLRYYDASQSLFFCERIEPGQYVEVTSLPFFNRLKESSIEHLVLYFHGFNNLPEDAFEKADIMQKAFGDSVAVIPIVWPCKKGSEDNILPEYYSDQHAADATGMALARALGKFWGWQQEEDPCQKRINVLAHSMGNRVLRRALGYWSNNLLHHAPPYLFRNCFMAAADVANQTLEIGEEGEAISFASRNVVVYFSGDDLALRASKIANASQVSRRLGHTGPFDITATPDNVYAFDCSDVSSPFDQNGHSYIYNDEMLAHVLASVQKGRIDFDGEFDGRTGILDFD